MSSDYTGFAGASTIAPISNHNQSHLDITMAERPEDIQTRKKRLEQNLQKNISKIAMRKKTDLTNYNNAVKKHEEDSDYQYIN